MSTRFLVVGHGARETAMARRLASEFNEVCAFTIHENHGLTQICGPQHVILGKTYDPASIISVAKDLNTEIIVPGHEGALYAGLTEYAAASKIHVFGPSQAVCRLEKDKTFSRDIVRKIDSDYLVEAETFFSAEDVFAAVSHRTKPLVLKCWDSNKQNYQTHILLEENNDRIEIEVFRAFNNVDVEYNSEHPPVIIEEFIEGQDFSIYVVTDGVNFSFSPSMQDYPFLNNNNIGPKTGGMGCITAEKANLPFLSHLDYERAKDFIQRYLEYTSTILGEVKGMYSFQFFKSKEGLKFNEIDVRPGDPEMVNYLSLLKSRFDHLIEGVCSLNLEQQIFDSQACVSVYLTTPGYPREKDVVQFSLNERSIIDANCNVFFGQVSLMADKTFLSQGSRSLVISSTDKNIEKCKVNIDAALGFNRNVGLFWREDIGRLYSNDEILFPSSFLKWSP